MAPCWELLRSRRTRKVHNRHTRDFDLNLQNLTNEDSRALLVQTTQLSVEQQHESTKNNHEGIAAELTKFALKAQIIYPINQTFQPLVQDSSNPVINSSRVPVSSEQTCNENGRVTQSGAMLVNQLMKEDYYGISRQNTPGGGQLRFRKSSGAWQLRLCGFIEQKLQELERDFWKERITLFSIALKSILNVIIGNDGVQQEFCEAIFQKHCKSLQAQEKEMQRKSQGTVEPKPFLGLNYRGGCCECVSVYLSHIELVQAWLARGAGLAPHRAEAVGMMFAESLALAESLISMEQAARLSVIHEQLQHQQWTLMEIMTSDRLGQGTVMNRSRILSNVLDAVAESRCGEHHQKQDTLQSFEHKGRHLVAQANQSWHEAMQGIFANQKAERERHRMRFWKAYPQAWPNAERSYISFKDPSEEVQQYHLSLVGLRKEDDMFCRELDEDEAVSIRTLYKRVSAELQRSLASLLETVLLQAGAAELEGWQKRLHIALKGAALQEEEVFHKRQKIRQKHLQKFQQGWLDKQQLLAVSLQQFVLQEGRRAVVLLEHLSVLPESTASHLRVEHSLGLLAWVSNLCLACLMAQVRMAQQLFGAAELPGRSLRNWKGSTEIQESCLEPKSANTAISHPGCKQVKKQMPLVWHIEEIEDFINKQFTEGVRIAQAELRCWRSTVASHLLLASFAECSAVWNCDQIFRSLQAVAKTLECDDSSICCQSVLGVLWRFGQQVKNVLQLQDQWKPWWSNHEDAKEEGGGMLTQKDPCKSSPDALTKDYVQDKRDYASASRLRCRRDNIQAWNNIGIDFSCAGFQHNHTGASEMCCSCQHLPSTQRKHLQTAFQDCLKDLTGPCETEVQ
uniref:evC complex member EVC isoform X2 n=1 Tax=Myxine glutinosa TaxID=7769 RepID=UPI00358F7BA5